MTVIKNTFKIEMLFKHKSTGNIARIVSVFNNYEMSSLIDITQMGNGSLTSATVPV